MIRRLILTIAVLAGMAGAAGPAFAQYAPVYGFCTAGTASVTLSGLTAAPQVQGSYPGCTVTVNLDGGGGAATIYSDATGTPLGNPFTASSTTGYWQFYASPGVALDVTISGGGLPSPFTYSYLIPAPLFNGSYTWPGLQIFNGGITTASANTLGGTLSITATGTTGSLTAGSGLLGGNNGWTGNETHSGTEGFSGLLNATGGLTANNVNKTIVLDGTTYTTLAAVVSAAQTAGGARIVVPPGTYSVSTNLFSSVTVPIEFDFTGPSEVNFTATQVITTNDISFRMEPNPAMSEIASANPEAPQTSGLRFKATASLSGPMFQITGPILGFNLSNVHFDCDANATWAVEADRMQASKWQGMISADNCTSGGFKFPNNASGGTNNGENQDTNFNNIDFLMVTRSPECVEFDQNSAGTANFSNNTIMDIRCSLPGTSGATDEVYFQGADDNYLGHVWCQINGGTGSAKSCIHFSANAYSNEVTILDPGIPSAPAVLADSGPSYPNVINYLSLANWISAGGNSTPGQVTANGPVIWDDSSFTLGPAAGGASEPSNCNTYIATSSGSASLYSHICANGGDGSLIFDSNSGSDIFKYQGTIKGAFNFTGTTAERFYAWPDATGTVGLLSLTSLTTTAATSDNVTVTGMTSSGHCSLTATNSSAAANIATTYVSAKTTNQITVTHTATSGMTYDIACTPN